MLLWMTFSQTWSFPSAPLTFLLPLVDLALWSPRHHPVPALPQAQRFVSSSIAKAIPFPLTLALKLSSLRPATSLASLLLRSVPSSRPEPLWKSADSPSTPNTPISFPSPSWPSLVLWIKFKISALIFVALYNSRQLLLAHNCCNDPSMVVTHSYIPMSTPTHTPVCKHGMCWLRKDRGTTKAKSSIYFCSECQISCFTKSQPHPC